MSLDLDSVIAVLQQHDLPSPTVQSIAKALIAAQREEAEAKASEAAANPKVKTKMVVLIRGDASLRALVAGGGWIVRVKEDDNTVTLQDRIKAVARAFNEKVTRYRSTRCIKTFAQAMERGKGKVVKEVGAYSCLTRQGVVEIQIVEHEEVV